MILGHQIEEAVSQLGTTHVVWLPDTALGQWEEALEKSASFDLLRVCREGEAWPLAAGLYLGGKSPLVMMQTTGLFESGDALRNVLFDLGIPLFALIGYRSYLVEDSPDTAKKFAEPILDAWGLRYELIQGSEDLPKLADHIRVCRTDGVPGVGLIAEGAM
jgi:sulfopyruvate decarboxylase TPP-binding subunit